MRRRDFNPRYAPSSRQKTPAAAPLAVLTVPLVARDTPRKQTSAPWTTYNAADSPSMHPQAKISPVAPAHIQPLRRITSLLLPIHYPDSFYHQILDPSSASLSRVILWEDPQSKETKVVGGLVCRLDPSLTPGSESHAPQIIDGSYDIYLQSLVLLSPYRENGLAAAALNSVIEAAIQLDGMKIRALYAHVWTENTEGLEWYSARGFQKDEEVISGYYKRLKPDSAWILRRNLMPSDHLAQTSSHQQLSDPTPAESKPPQSSTPPEIAGPRPGNPPHTKSFQDRRPDMEWNDLPEDVLGGSLLKAPTPSGEGSSASSRSTSRSGLEGKGRKKARAYPAAAFGS